MSTLEKAKEKYKEAFGRAAHHTWNEEQIQEKLDDKKESSEEGEKNKNGEEAPEKENNKKKELKPVHTSLFIPKFGETPARLVQRDDWSEQDTKDYREAYKDRLQKAMKKLK